MRTVFERISIIIGLVGASAALLAVWLGLPEGVAVGIAFPFLAASVLVNPDV
jgi:hypothetical protein